MDAVKDGNGLGNLDDFLFIRGHDSSIAGKKKRKKTAVHSGMFFRRIYVQLLDCPKVDKI